MVRHERAASEPEVDARFGSRKLRLEGEAEALDRTA